MHKEDWVAGNANRKEKYEPLFGQGDKYAIPFYQEGDPYEAMSEEVLK